MMRCALTDGQADRLAHKLAHPISFVFLFLDGSRFTALTFSSHFRLIPSHCVDPGRPYGTEQVPLPAAVHVHFRIGIAVGL